MIGRRRLDEELARRSLGRFASHVQSSLEHTVFHRNYYRLLDEFARGRIRRLMVSVPPQHGKSMGASQLLPAYLLGIDPDLRVCIGSYSFSLARRFGLGVQRIIGSDPYRGVFPATFLKGMNSAASGGNSIRTADEFDIVDANGGLRLVGREGSLTGSRVDVMILDDLYKDHMEANSPLIRDNTWEWYTSVVRTRMHNRSREAVIFTRWHEDDLIGRLSRSERIIDLTDFAQLDGLDPAVWVRVNFEALKTGEPTMVDPRQTGEPLWPSRHSAGLLLERQRLDPAVFEALYQGCPVTREGLLYGEFRTYDTLPERIVRTGNYTDTADTGTDMLCSVCYAVDGEGAVYVTDLIYTDRPMEETEREVARMLVANNIRAAHIESNNGGRGFARAVERITGPGVVRSFHQSAGKEARILTNASAVCASILMPRGWQVRWPGFAAELASFRRNFRANAHDDAADTLTGIVEKELYQQGSRIRRVGFFA